MDISAGWLKSDIHTWIYPWIYPWISISTASLSLPPPLNPLIYLMPYKQQNITSDSTAETNLTFAIEYSQFKCADSF